MNVLTAQITGIRYTPTIPCPLDTVTYNQLEEALIHKSAFYLQIDPNNKFAVSRWVSPKRTRSYPYARVYDTLQYSGKKITIIPIIKDEGFNGDRDYLQWDSVSLMSLLGVYVIIGYYNRAIKSARNPRKPKITEQQFDLDLIRSNIRKLLSYHSDALHWNIDQLNSAGNIGDKAITAYNIIGNNLKVPMHSTAYARKRFEMLRHSVDLFRNNSRQLANAAANRETQVINPQENVSGEKWRITITNFLGGEYNFTADEVWEKAPNLIQLVEAKHTRSEIDYLPAVGDIKDAIVKMILFTNLENVREGDKVYQSDAIMKLTCDRPFNIELLTRTELEFYKLLQNEARVNGFSIIHQ